jgi:hypothetical protein
MKKIQARAINEQNWILLEQGNRVALLGNNEGVWNLLNSSGSQCFDSLEQTQTALGAVIEFERLEKEEPAVGEIGNLPTRHLNPQNISHDEIVSYTKLPTSRVRFAAGYWGIRFDHGWVPGFCPKLETIQKYEHLGPFSTKLEMLTVIRQQGIRKEKRA